MIIFVFILGFYVIHWIKSESYKCLSNTPSYFMENLENSNKANVSCLCTVDKSPSVTVLLTDKGFEPLKTTITEEEYPEINYSAILK